MQNLKYLLLLLLIVACNDIAKPVEENKDSLAAVRQDSTTLLKAEAAAPKSAAVLYAEGIISGQNKLTENNETFAWLDSLQSDNKNTRQLAYQVAEVIMNKGQGFLSESVGGHLKSFSQVYPKDFIEHYRLSSAAQQKKLVENCACEFYASGDDYAVDIDNYFKDCTKACNDCTAEESQLLVTFRTKLEALVKSKNE